MGYIFSIVLFVSWLLSNQEAEYMLIASSIFAVAGGLETVAVAIKKFNPFSIFGLVNKK